MRCDIYTFKTKRTPYTSWGYIPKLAKNTQFLSKAEAKDADCKAFLYHTLQQLVKFHSSMSSLGGIEATEVLMKDFDTILG